MANTKTTHSRANVHLRDADELILITDPSDPLYDPRVERDPSPEIVFSHMLLDTINPITVTPRREGTAVRYVAIAGKGRVKAIRKGNFFLAEICTRLKSKVALESIAEALGIPGYIVEAVRDILQAAGVKELRRMVPCIVRQGDAKILRSIMVAENEARVDDPVSVKAKRARYLVESAGFSLDQAALAYTVSVQTIKNWLKIGSLAPAVTKAIDAGQIRATAAARLSKKTPEEQETLVTALVHEAEATGKRPTAQRTARAAGAPRMTPGKKELKAKYAEADIEYADDGTYKAGWRDALRWVLGMPDEVEEARR